jgi:hypothetical protein
VVSHDLLPTQRHCKLIPARDAGYSEMGGVVAIFFEPV